MDADPFELGALAAVGLVAGWVNTVAGAGSLLLLPALVFTGLDASEANATNRLAVLATTTAALLGYRRAGLGIGRRELALTAAAAAGGGLGAFLATLLRPDEMQAAIVVAMGVMLALSLVPPNTRTRAGGAAPGADAERVPAPTPGMVAAFVLIGVYGGFLQAGLGIVVLLYLSLGHGVSLVASNAVKSTVTFALTVVAIAVFAGRGEHIDLGRGAVLAVSSAAGGVLGARASVALGDRFVRAAVTLAVLASMAKLLADLR